ncbi:DUF3108 domain-containing protein [Alteromonas sp. 1_MG-2023]|uniref:DUF3108 domain-containing protein n=1 Tax=Alteromonas sp. 1_MG-2023 TaxID=3062669 RepID=UPI0026E46D12|nr:DUF3108 domain-containing protein [Alteromonas sp. 1_MG-2023]MDO6569121.1 DUF3108 domain-containing protein [Alteromonas sp. 1_MG-2023]
MSKNSQNRVMQTNKRGFIAAFLLAFVGVSAHAANVSENSLQPYEAVYTAYKWGDDVGEAHIKLEALSNAQYSLTYSSKVSKFFLSDKRYEHSIFKVEDSAVLPIEYHYTRTGTGPDKNLTVNFNTNSGGKVVVKDGDEFAWNGQFDNQIYRVDLANQLASGETNLTYDFVNYRGELRTYGVEVVGNENLSLPYGEFETVKVKLIRDSKTRETFAWFAPSLNYTLVRLQQFKDGEEQGDIKLKSYTSE